ncbi:MAG: hypothetical protein HY974_03790 [Candidatus Kerfeldbacteria bacterium]|nr:hypothetical protein [Candidatus Kerfeldbacteria bacterium]
MPNLLYNLTSVPTLLFMVIVLRFLVIDAAKAFSDVSAGLSSWCNVGAVLITVSSLKTEKHSTESSHEPEVHPQSLELFVRFLSQRLGLEQINKPSLVEARTWQAVHCWTNCLTILCPSREHTA